MNHPYYSYFIDMIINYYFIMLLMSLIDITELLKMLSDPDILIIITTDMIVISIDMIVTSIDMIVISIDMIVTSIDMIVISILFA